MNIDRSNYDRLEGIATDLESLARQLRRCQISIFKDDEGRMGRRKSMIELQEDIQVSLEESTQRIQELRRPTASQEKLCQLFETLIAELKAFNEKLDGNEPTA
jgi:hypothetical protein